MALSKSQLQKLWRARRDIKARFFEDLDRERQDRLTFPQDMTDKPEGVALQHFFVNYPLCRYTPSALTFQNGAWIVDFDEPSRLVYREAAAAVVALREASSLPVIVRTADTPGGLTFNRPMCRLEKLVGEISSEVRDMRTARMWGAQ